MAGANILPSVAASPGRTRNGKKPLQPVSALSAASSPRLGTRASNRHAGAQWHHYLRMPGGYDPDRSCFIETMFGKAQSMCDPPANLRAERLGEQDRPLFHRHAIIVAIRLDADGPDTGTGLLSQRDVAQTRPPGTRVVGCNRGVTAMGTSVVGVK